MNTLLYVACLVNIGSAYDALIDGNVESLAALLLANSPAALRRYSPTMAVAEAETEYLNLGNLRASPGSNRKKKRKGRGDSAGQGGTCGFGNDGAKARSGSPRPYVGFEGGQTQNYRLLPKFVGRPLGYSRPGSGNLGKKEYNIIKLDKLSEVPEGSEVTITSLFDSGLISKSKQTYGAKRLHKVVGGTKTPAKGITVKAHAITKSALEAIKANGGKFVKLRLGESSKSNDGRK